jgi:hypothetical protein
MIIKNCSKQLKVLIPCPIISNNSNNNMYKRVDILQIDIKVKESLAISQAPYNFLFSGHVVELHTQIER